MKVIWKFSHNSSYFLSVESLSIHTFLTFAIKADQTEIVDLIYEVDKRSARANNNLAIYYAIFCRNSSLVMQFINDHEDIVPETILSAPRSYPIDAIQLVVENLLLEPYCALKKRGSALTIANMAFLLRSAADISQEYVLYTDILIKDPIDDQAFRQVMMELDADIMPSCFLLLCGEELTKTHSLHSLWEQKIYEEIRLFLETTLSRRSYLKVLHDGILEAIDWRNGSKLLDLMIAREKLNDHRRSKDNLALIMAAMETREVQILMIVAERSNHKKYQKSDFHTLSAEAKTFLDTTEVLQSFRRLGLITW
jgi:hypothetical protein